MLRSAGPKPYSAEGTNTQWVEATIRSFLLKGDALMQKNSIFGHALFKRKPIFGGLTVKRPQMTTNQDLAPRYFHTVIPDRTLD